MGEWLLSFFLSTLFHSISAFRFSLCAYFWSYPEMILKVFPYNLESQDISYSEISGYDIEYYDLNVVYPDGALMLAKCLV